MDGLLRYNAIQRALSSYKRETGVPLPAGFHRTASQIYHASKKQPIKAVTQNIESFFQLTIPQLPEDYFQANYFFNYNIDNPNGQGIISENIWPDNLLIKAPQLKGKDWIGSSADVEYNAMFKPFSDFCNKNLGVFWTDSGNAPRFWFEAIEFDPVENSYVTTLRIDQEDAYGFIPGTEVQIATPKAVLPKSAEKAPEKPKEKPISPDKEIEKIKAETARQEAIEKKLVALNTAVANLESQFERGLISKKQYSKYLKDLYEA
jgi:hypothetical protein